MRNVAVIGAGVMGRRIAYGCIIKGLQTRIFDISNEASAAALDVIEGYIEERESEGRLPKGTLETNFASLSAAGTLRECVAGADLIIETVNENPKVLRKVSPLGRAFPCCWRAHRSGRLPVVACFFRQPGGQCNARHS